VTAQIIGTVLVTASVCGVLAFVALMRQAANHSDDRAALLREHLDTLRALRVQEPEPEDDREWWDWQFDGIAAGIGDAGFGDDEGEAP
jgi:hypothetical protein